MVLFSIPADRLVLARPSTDATIKTYEALVDRFGFTLTRTEEDRSDQLLLVDVKNGRSFGFSSSILG